MRTGGANAPGERRDGDLSRHGRRVAPPLGNRQLVKGGPSWPNGSQYFDRIGFLGRQCRAGRTLVPSNEGGALGSAPSRQQPPTMR